MGYDLKSRCLVESRVSEWITSKSREAVPWETTSERLMEKLGLCSRTCMLPGRGERWEKGIGERK